MTTARGPARVVLVTGAAGAIGSATVHAFLDAGFTVVGLDRERATAATDRSMFITVDLGDDDAVAGAVAQAGERGPISHVVGIAGGALDEEPGLAGDPAMVSPALFRASLENNLTAQFVVAHAVLPILRAVGGDRSVTFTSSWNALTGAGMPAYSAAKAGLIGLMHALTGPLGADGIRVNVVAPGTVVTPRTQRIWASDVGHFERLADTTALGRLGAPVDIARTFVALATELTHVTGQVIVVDGGQMVKRS